MNKWALGLTLAYNSVAGCLAMDVIPAGRFHTLALVASMVMANALALFFNKVVPAPQKGLPLPPDNLNASGR